MQPSCEAQSESAIPTITPRTAEEIVPDTRSHHTIATGQPATSSVAVATCAHRLIDGAV
jgi:hypothetical protein